MPQSIKYFFDQDCSCHWYMIPASLRSHWTKVKNMPEDDPETWEAFERFEEYTTGGGIQDIEFTIDN